MGTKTKKKMILAAPQIVERLPELKGRAPRLDDTAAIELLRIGSLFEIPVRSPSLMARRYRFIPFFLKRWVRAVYGLAVFLHEKFDGHRKDAFFLVLEEMWLERKARQQKRGSQRRQVMKENMR